MTVDISIVAVKNYRKISYLFTTMVQFWFYYM